MKIWLVSVECDLKSGMPAEVEMYKNGWKFYLQIFFVESYLKSGMPAEVDMPAPV